MRQLPNELVAISNVPSEHAEAWFADAESSVEFLKLNAASEDIIIYAYLPYVMIHGVLAPAKKVKSPDKDDLKHAHVMPDACWSISHISGGGKPDRVLLSDPMSDTRSKTLKGGEKLVFVRKFEGNDDIPDTEISQKLVHALDLYYVAERNAYCRLDGRGDIEEVISIITTHKHKLFGSGRVVTIKTKYLAKYMTLSCMALIIKFDFTRCPESFAGWVDHQNSERIGKDMFYNYAVIPGHASYVNGRQIIRSNLTRRQIIRENNSRWDASKRKYAKFLIHDWKNKRQIVTSCAPTRMASYFEPNSPLPFEVSPVFFRPEVLTKYKNDTWKYTLDGRSISCRGAWYLETYDINDAGQVHTYLIYLSRLPYEEQLYWQSFNEAPKGTISERAYQTDFLGQFSTIYDPLQSIKQQIAALDDSSPSWWKPRGEEVQGATHYPVTSSSNEWAAEIMRLDQLVNEGFAVPGIRSILTTAGIVFDKEWKSLKLIEEFYTHRLGSKANAADLISPLRKINTLRSQLVGHAATQQRKKHEKQAIADHGSYKAHYEQIASDCDRVLRKIVSDLGGPRFSYQNGGQK